ncbi:ABC transporter permease [Carbonactinospora thermoautotrophica]|uniref:ABC transporter permease n=1 Tax=Carbonactinospora thermoautotrophica TaxID=1469144 RepID=A0A132N6W0_9ACTN|nr:ABC transporter permease [Carbonactinospora thermoautotrophica]KWX01311.1 Oligopeptide transport integral membrane protein [Carbonactinospora thermoautotrophica]KWX05727.1 ABC transporter permease [Carbonactinospora thermoautotrophica]KWX08682.1 ABC transporter permease [Carbonactinospora thermoautotrophica]MCX9192118.1 ABC transporter permease [Carbonactinospora thermoautotrophica]
MSLQTTASVEETGGGVVREAFQRLRRNPSAITGFVLIVLFVLVALFAPLLAPYDPKDVDLSQVPRAGEIPGPSAEHWLGVDELGRDELSRLLFGARQSLVIGVGSLLMGLVVGVLLGLLAGAFGGWVDTLIMRVVDMMLAVPGLLFAIAVAAMLGPSTTSVMIAIAVVTVPVFARLLRGQMLAQRESDYVLAARSLGVRQRDIVLRHVLPNSLTPVLVQGTLTLATAIIDAAGLAFLGLSGNDPSTPEWGRMLADTQRYLSAAPQLAVFPGLAIVISALGFTLLGEAMREALDPKYRR